MRILIADDDVISRRLLEATLTKWGYEVQVVCDGHSALEALGKPDAPSLAILDWMMPNMDGVEVCRHFREQGRGNPTYILLLTARDSKKDLITGLDAGADDYLTKPFDRGELKARLRAGIRMIEMQRNLAERVRQLEEAMSRVKQLQGLIPICAYCKKIRGDEDYWEQVEAYISEHSNARFTHGICPHCIETVVKPEMESLAIRSPDVAAIGSA